MRVLLAFPKKEAVLGESFRAGKEASKRTAVHCGVQRGGGMWFSPSPNHVKALEAGRWPEIGSRLVGNSNYIFDWGSGATCRS